MIKMPQLRTLNIFLSSYQIACYIPLPTFTPPGMDLYRMPP
jgi:hypothetical protein